MMKFLHFSNQEILRHDGFTLSWDTAGALIELQSSLGQSGIPVLTLLKLDHVLFCTLNEENEIITQDTTHQSRYQE